MRAAARELGIQPFDISVFEADFHALRVAMNRTGLSLVLETHQKWASTFIRCHSMNGMTKVMRALNAGGFTWASALQYRLALGGDPRSRAVGKFIQKRVK